MLAQRYHVCGGYWRIKLVDQAAAMIQHRVLIDRALVGDFAAVDRSRRSHRQGLDQSARGAGSSQRPDRRALFANTRRTRDNAELTSKTNLPGRKLCS